MCYSYYNSLANVMCYRGGDIMFTVLLALIEAFFGVTFEELYFATFIIDLFAINTIDNL